MQSSLFAFAVDLADEGHDTVLSALKASGVGGISLAVAYHNARDLLPHNPRRTVYYHEGGTIFFHPAGRYGAIRPVVAGLAADRDPLAELCEAASRHDVEARAWTVYLHNSRLASQYPECAPENVFGDRYVTDLCPAHPDVRHFAATLTADIARYPITSIMAEALHFKPLVHGYHHERYFVDLGPAGRVLLGLCFCSWCRAAALEAGVDADAVAASVQEVLRGWLDAGSGSDEPADRASLAALVGEELLGYLAARATTVTSLVSEVRAVAADAGVVLTFSAHGGSAKGGSTQSLDDPSDDWVLGVDLTAAGAADEYEMLGYAEDPDDVAGLFAAYIDALPEGMTVAAALRPMWPDTRSAADLAVKVDLARRSGAARVDFYHYGLMPRRSLGWIANALSG